MKVSRDHLKALMDAVREINQCAANQERARYWQIVPNEQWQPAFIRTLPAARHGGKIPFVVEPALAMWADILHFDLRTYYSDPLTYLTAQLEMKVYHARRFADDTYIDKTVRLMFATLLEGSVLGAPYGFTDQGHPWLDYRHPPLQSTEDLARLPAPDFRTSGIMPQVHRFYGEMVDLLDDDFLVKFPDWIMGPFGVACELRGFDTLLLDLVSDSPFAAKLLERIVSARLAWQQECERFLGIKRTRGLLGNDDVNCPTLSPALYRDAILPFELELCRRSGGIFYWHSCGETTRLLAHVASIPTLDLFHCGPWTDVAAACRVMGGRDIPLEIMVETVDKVQMASPEQQRRTLAAVAAQIPDSVDCFVKVDSLEVTRDLPTELAAIGSWLKAARAVFG